MRRRIAMLLCLGLVASARTADLRPTDLYVVVNAHNTVQMLTRRDVIALFTGRSRVFPDGDVAQPYDQASDSAARALFYRALTGMDLARINSYWSRLLFTGQVQPPRLLADDMDVIERLRGDRNGIGYLTSRPKDAALRVVFVLHEGAGGTP
jgi:hypothetical protein